MHEIATVSSEESCAGLPKAPMPMPPVTNEGTQESEGSATLLPTTKGP